MRHTVENDQLRWAVFTAQLLGKDLGPDLFGGGQNTGRELSGGVIGGGCLFALLGLRCIAALHEPADVDPGEIPNGQHNQQAQNTHPARASLSSPAASTAHFYVTTASAASQSHNHPPYVVPLPVERATSTMGS